MSFKWLILLFIAFWIEENIVKGGDNMSAIETIVVYGLAGLFILGRVVIPVISGIALIGGLIIITLL